MKKTCRGGAAFVADAGGLQGFKKRSGTSISYVSRLESGFLYLIQLGKRLVWSYSSLVC
jgi:hypothetical protein